MKKQEALGRRIDRDRQTLYDLAKLYGFNHDRVLKQSRMLDELINQYNRTVYKHTKKPTA